jgi:hypothetical protein
MIDLKQEWADAEESKYQFLKVALGFLSLMDAIRRVSRARSEITEFCDRDVGSFGIESRTPFAVNSRRGNWHLYNES